MMERTLSVSEWMMNDPNTKFKLTILKSATFENKVWRNSPHTYDLLPTFVWVVFLAYCAIRQTSFNDRKDFVSEWMKDQNKKIK